MKKEIKLMTVFNYAKREGVTTTWIYKQIKSGVLKSQKIDGMTFVIA